MFPSRVPWFSFAGFALALVTLAVGCFAWVHFVATPLQRFYLSSPSGYTYPKLIFTTKWMDRDSPQPYLVMLDAHDDYLASDTIATVPDYGKLRYAFRVRTPVQMQALLADQIFEGGFWSGAAKWTWRITFGLSVLFIIAGRRADLYIRRQSREGIHKRGPRLWRVWQYNWKTKGNGLPIRVA